MADPNLSAAVLAVLLILFAIDYRQTFWNLANNNETNRAILWLYGRLGSNGVALWFGGAAVASLLLFAVSLNLDKPGAIVVLGVFWIGIELSYIRANFKQQGAGDAG